MEITTLSQNSIKIKGRNASLVIDPQKDSSKTDASAILFLRSKDTSQLSKIEGYRLVIEGPGEYEVSGIKISAFPLNSHIAYNLRIDGIGLFVASADALGHTPDSNEDYQVVVLASSPTIHESVITALSPKAIVLYGPDSLENAKKVGATISQTKKYQTTLEKLPQELEVVVIQ